MELALSLGGADPVPTTPFLFLDRKNVNKDLGFCMGLGTRSCGQDQDRRLIDLSSADPTVQLRPSPVLARLPWMTHNKLMSENRRSPVDDVAEVGPNSATVATPMFQMDFSGKKRDHLESERACSRTSEEDENDSVSTRKKLRLSKDQSAFLEESFKEHSSLNPKLKLALAKKLSLRPRQVEVWFQNRRARTKLKQTEVDCEYLKRSCEKLGEENKRLQKELQELRALKTILPFQNQLPPTTLTMCPSCERVASTSTVTTAVTNSPASSIDKPTLLFPFFQAQAQ